ncbi:MAG: hypothetical protein WBB74_01455 [Gaiellaceae bacterium]
MTTVTRKLDRLIERGADKLQGLAADAARSGGMGAKIAGELAEDAVFLRKLKPSLIAARARGRAPTEQASPPVAPREPAPNPNPRKPRGRGGPGPLLVIGAAFALGLLAAHVIDSRSHAHQRD